MTEPAAGRQQSEIGFPYGDLEDAISVARGLLDGGGVPLSRERLASVLRMSPGGGGFNTKINTARMFGLMETAQGKYQLTDLGFEILDASREKKAMVEAFLTVPLFRRAYEEFRGRQLPPRPQGLETAFVNFGVSPKQKDRARHAFDRSARTAGFFHNGQDDRLIEPLPSSVQAVQTTYSVVPEQIEASPVTYIQTAPSGNSREMASLHRSILGMMEELPTPKSEWDASEQADWLGALATMFRVIYKTTGGSVSVTVKPPSEGASS